MSAEPNPCPLCGALPCDWVDDPHQAEVSLCWTLARDLAAKLSPAHPPSERHPSMTDYLQKARELVMDFDGAVYAHTDIAHLTTTLEALETEKHRAGRAEASRAFHKQKREQAEAERDEQRTRADKAEADRDRYAGLLMLAQEQHGKIKAERDALLEFVAVFACDPCACGIAINKPCLPCKARALIQPEPDPLVEEERIFCATVWNALKGDHNDLRRQQIILDAFRSARHGLAVKEDTRHD